MEVSVERKQLLNYYYGCYELHILCFIIAFIDFSLIIITFGVKPN